MRLRSETLQLLARCALLRIRVRIACAAFAILLGGAGEAPGRSSAIELDVVGGLAGLTQYERHEQRFWKERVLEITDGRVPARIVPLERSGVRGQQVLQLLRLGVIPFGNILLGLAAADEPELNAVDLPLLSPDIRSLRRAVAAWRPRLEAVLRERYGLNLLAVYTYPAQVIFCREPFDNISDLAGRRVRTSSVGQSELIGALGGTPVVIPFAEIVSAIRAGVVDCAITAAGSGNLIGLHEVTNHVSRLGISWGVSIFAANQAAWDDLPEDIRAHLRQGLVGLEQEVWASAERETEAG